jgi:L-histidine Nalpha-methyltransferase
MREPVTTVSDRLEIIELTRAAATQSFADDVRAGLSAPSKSISSKYFYDSLGSALFDAITQVHEYYLTRAETEILREWGWEIVRILNEPVEFLELGSGSATKTRILIEEALRVQSSLRYSPIDISAETLRVASSVLVDSYPRLTVRAYAGDYFTVLASKVVRFERRALAMLMGSNIGNYAPQDARSLVELIASALRPGDGLLIGVDRKKDRETLELAYDDPAGVTAAFDRNLLARVNRELGGTFALRNFDHVARYDEDRGYVDSYLQARFAQHVTIAGLNMEVSLAAGERIHTESSYKFNASDIQALAQATGFSLTKSWHDRAHRFDVHLLIRS